MCFAEIRRHILRYGPRRMGSPLGPLLREPRMSLRDWSDRADDGRGWLVKLEFALVGGLMSISLILLAISFLWPTPAEAHPVGLAADGCHNDRKNGGRHCHRASSS